VLRAATNQKRRNPIIVRHYDIGNFCSDVVLLFISASDLCADLLSKKREEILHVGQRGLYVTCGTAVEHKCRKELYNLLNAALERWEQLHPEDVFATSATSRSRKSSDTSKMSTSTTTIAAATTSPEKPLIFFDALQHELDGLTVSHKERAFVLAQTGCAGVVFIAFADHLRMRPSEFLLPLLEEMVKSPRTRFF
jgi:hypothetical protein